MLTLIKMSVTHRITKQMTKCVLDGFIKRFP